jgi:ketosteroid isomerase-like protein
METVKATIEDFVRSHDDGVRMKDASQLLRTLTTDCTRSLRPASFLQEMGMPVDAVMSNEMFLAHFESLIAFMGSATTTLLDSVVDAPGRRAVIHITHHVNMADGENDATLENAIFLHFTEDGSKINKIVEYADSIATKRFMGLIAAARAAAAGDQKPVS